MKPKDIQRIISSTDAQTASIEIVELFSKYQEEQDKKLYSEEDMIEFGEIIAWNMVGKTITESFVRTISKKCLEQFKKK